VNTVEQEALGQWQSLTPPTLTGNPPILQGSGYQALQILGQLLNFDKNMSPSRTEACAFGHMPYAGFSGPIPSVNLTMIAYPGSAHYRAAKRAAMRYPYATNFPVLQYNSVQGLFFGGNF
jgi:cytochrome c peroxidase